LNLYFVNINYCKHKTFRYVFYLANIVHITYIIWLYFFTSLALNYELEKIPLIQPFIMKWVISLISQPVVNYILEQFTTKIKTVSAYAHLYHITSRILRFLSPPDRSLKIFSPYFFVITEKLLHVPFSGLIDINPQDPAL
jgi:hypothetical protein